MMKKKIPVETRIGVFVTLLSYTEQFVDLQAEK